MLCRAVLYAWQVLCASNDAHDAVEPLTPPADAPVGERVWFGEEGKTQAAAAEPNRCVRACVPRPLHVCLCG